MTKDQARDALVTFNSKVEKILKYSFFRSKISFAHSWNVLDGEAIVETQYPSDEAIDAVILNLRFFILHGELCSHHRIRGVYDIACTDGSLRALFEHAYDAWTAWNNMASGVVGTTNERLFEVFFYGERAHRNNPANYEEYDKWKANVNLFEFAMVKFCGKVDELVRILHEIRLINKKVLEVCV